MHKIILLFTLLFHASFFFAYAQTILTELPLPTDKIDNIQSFKVGDKIFLTYDEKNPESKQEIKKSFHIYPNGRTKQIHFNLMANTIFCGALPFGSDEYLYYLEDKGKAIAIKAALYNDSTDTSILLTHEIEINGSLLCTWNDDNLHLVIYNKDLNQIEILELNKLEIVSQKKIVAPIDLKPYYRDMIYIGYDAAVSIAQGSSKAKLYQNGQFVFITIDKTSYDLNNRVSETLIVKFDLANESSSSKKINYNTEKRFSSFLFRDKVYRVTVSKNYYDLSIFDLTAKKLIDAKKISKDSSINTIRKEYDKRLKEEKEIDLVRKPAKICPSKTLRNY